jgi:hypothetical protein
LTKLDAIALRPGSLSRRGRYTGTDKERHLLLHLFPTTLYGRMGYPVRHSRSENDIAEDSAMTQFDMSNGFKLHLLTRFMLELIDGCRLVPDDFAPLLSKIANIDVSLSETIAHGIQRFFDQDYLSALYILTLQLEEYLRKLLFVLGAQTTVYTRSAFQEKTLGSILDELQNYLPTNLHRYIAWALDDYRGLHLRNDVAHGFIKKQDVSPMYVAAVLHIIILLTVHLRIRDDTGEEPGDAPGG